MTSVLGVSEERGTTASRTSDPRIRTAIAVIMTRFPRIDETFILREIDELERQGQPVLLVPLLRGDTTVIHEEAKPWMRRAMYTPLLSPRIIASNLRIFLRSPGKYCRLLWRLIAGTFIRPSTLLHVLALFPKAVHLAEVLPARGIRHVHAHFAAHATTLAYIIGSLSDITYSFSVHGPDVFVHRLLLREKIRQATFVRAISVFNKAFLSGLYPAESRRRIEVVHSGVNSDVYREAAAAGRHAGRHQLLSVAALTASRGFPFLVDACSRLAKAGMDIECKIVGAGPLRRTTLHWIQSHGLADSVRLLGALPQHEVARLMGEADVFVLPSIIAVDGQMDGIPVSLMEAMAAGKPVIASAISGIPELVKDGVNGLIVDATHPERVAEAVRRLLDDPTLRERMGAAGQQRVRDSFDIRRTTQALVALFDRHRDINAAPSTIEERVRALDWSRLGVSAVGVRRVDEQPDSVIVEVTITDGSHRREVIVRQQRDDGDGAEAAQRARHLFEMLSTLEQSMSPNEVDGITYSVPRVLMFDEPRAAVVVERADGKSLGGLVDAARSSGLTGKLRLPLRRAGTWLRLMQIGTRAAAEDGRHLLTAVVVLAIQDLDLAMAGERALRQKRDAIVSRLRTLESRLAMRPLEVTSHHGNFGPASVFVGNHSVRVIDFVAAREGLALEDVANFTLHLAIAFGERRAERLQRAFIDGYLAAGGTVDEEALDLFTMTAGLRMLAHGASGRTAYEQWKSRRIARHIITRSARIGLRTSSRVP